MSLSKPWADGPFKLMHTPKFENEASSEDSECLTAASWMAVLHNGLIRGLNTIYLQAPHVQSADYADFTAYSLLWSETINSHHHGEETGLFPAIELAAGPDGKGLMDENYKQHDSFHRGIMDYEAYLQDLQSHPQDFDPGRLLSLISAFGPALHKHLVSEISTLLALASHDSPIPALTLWKADAARKKTGKWARMQHYLFFMFNHDVTFEAPLWTDYPKMDYKVRLAMVYGASWWNWRVWKFACCDSRGRPRELYAGGVGEDGSSAGEGEDV